MQSRSERALNRSGGCRMGVCGVIVMGAPPSCMFGTKSTGRMRRSCAGSHMCGVAYVVFSRVSWIATAAMITVTMLTAVISIRVGMCMCVQG